VGVFTYSHEEGTDAFGMDDDVAADVKEDRARRIMEVQQEISTELNESKLGKVMKVLVDRKEAGRYIGRTEFDSVEVDNEVIIHAGKKLVIGEFVEVRITKAYDYDLEAELI
jgi:ribosomal protein S12 methylthiotransferase